MTNKLIELFDLTGTHALVTGGGSGIGFHIAKTLGTVGAEVTLIDRNVEPLEAARKALIDEGITAHSLPLDITDYEDFDSKLAAHASGHPFQVVFANAGISAGPGPVNDSGNLANYDRDRWRDVIDVNLTGAMNTLSITSRHMEAQGRGRIVVTASLAGVRADPLVGYAYAASKTGVIGIVRNAALELGTSGITVNAIAPGLFETNIRKNNPAAQALDGAFAKMSAVKRSGQMQELEGLAIFLASKSSSYITGAVLNIDGGGQHVGPTSLN